jgi:hypothetical protein
MGRVLLLASFLSIIPAGLSAQGRGSTPVRTGGVGPSPAAAVGVHSAVSMAPGRVAVHGSSSPGNRMVASRLANGQMVIRRAGTAIRGPSHVRAIGSATRNGQLTTSRRRNGVSDFSDNSSVPGLGFDYSHVAATHPNGVNGRHRRNDNSVLFPFFGGGGYFIPTGSEIAGDVQGEGQQVGDAEEEDSVSSDRPARVRSVDRLPVEVPLGPPAPARDVPEYVFVRRDGTVFFAVAYSWDKGALRYVSSEGLRRSVARETLDLNATQQFNEQRGMTFRSPA